MTVHGLLHVFLMLLLRFYILSSYFSALTDNMTINILYFASLSEALGKQQDHIETAQAITAQQAWQQANPTQAMPPKTLIAINQEYADADSLVQVNDELAFFPPVTGG